MNSVFLVEEPVEVVELFEQDLCGLGSAAFLARRKLSTISVPRSRRGSD